jgi:hypothetical protein
MAIKKLKKPFFTEEKNFLNKEELEIINQSVLGRDFPWYYVPAATTDKFQCFSHVLIHRYDPNNGDPVENSSITSFFVQILKRFCKKHKIKINKITRGTINLTSHHNEYQSGDPHVDHLFKHKSFIIYLNDAVGDTIIYDKKYDGRELLDINEKTPIFKKIKPESGKAICWDGEYYHAASYPKEGKRRIVLVMTFI